MDIGMQWFDDNPAAELAEKVTRAASYYASKYGCKPNVCFVHPGALTKGGKDNVGGIEIKTSRTVLRHHFWLGIQQAPAIN
jgi:hypothetical protein